MKDPGNHLPGPVHRIKNALSSIRIPVKLILIIIGAASTIWFLVRVIPKPSRASYPCMQAASPFMATFVLYLLSVSGSLIAYKRVKHYMAGSRYLLASFFIVLLMASSVISFSLLREPASAATEIAQKGEFPPNQPMGTAQGIHPGRVVWVYDSDATNENCTNTANLNGVLDDGDDGYYMAKNNNPDAIDYMVYTAITQVAGEEDNAVAWDAIFRHYNTRHGGGDIGYTPGEKILIKTNATSMYGNAGGGSYNSDLSIDDHGHGVRFNAETNPYVVLSMLRQLVNIAGVAEEYIYVGDPMKNIYKEFYDMWHAEFPDVKYLGNDIHYNGIQDLVSLGRTPVVAGTSTPIYYADQGTVMPDAVVDYLYSIFGEVDYMINIPTLKAHACAGITLSAKNHYGSHTRSWSIHLHDGLLSYTNDNPTRLGYGLYRTQTDFLTHEKLGGMTLLVLVDGLYPGEEAISTPFKWDSEPFSGDWCSSLFTSLDQVALESVCHDFLRTEYNGTTVAESRPNWDGVDDYLHQAADSANWPEGMVYDPEDDGILIASLGVHEHWNNETNPEYTRNLGTGNGIELITVFSNAMGLEEEGPGQTREQIAIYPNPASDYITADLETGYKLELYEVSGRLILASETKTTNISHLVPGTYIYSVIGAEGQVISTGKVMVQR